MWLFAGQLCKFENFVIALDRHCSSTDKVRLAWCRNNQGSAIVTLCALERSFQRGVGEEAGESNLCVVVGHDIFSFLGKHFMFMNKP